MTTQGNGHRNHVTGAKTVPVKKVGSFADAVAKGSLSAESMNDGDKVQPITKRLEPKPIHDDSRKTKTSTHSQAVPDTNKSAMTLPVDAPAYEPSSIQNNVSGSPKKANAPSMTEEPISFAPQSFHDVIEVLCSGETTPGKLLMHFLLFYGQHFDSHSTAIDYSNTHQRDPNSNNGYAISSPYLLRGNTGSYDPMTGMLTVDPIVVYDPLQGAEMNNVARSCFAWSSIRWVFAQSYMTLASAVEMSAGQLPGSGARNRGGPTAQTSPVGISEFQPSGQQEAWGIPYLHDESGNVILDPSTPLLELLLSF